MDNELTHYGVLGMKWGVRRSQTTLDRAAGRKQAKAEKRESKKITKIKKQNQRSIKKEVERKNAYDKMTKSQQQAYDRLTDNGRDKYWSDRFWNGSGRANATLDMYGIMKLSDYTDAKLIRDGARVAVRLVLKR